MDSRDLTEAQAIAAAIREEAASHAELEHVLGQAEYWTAQAQQFMGLSPATCGIAVIDEGNLAVTQALDEAAAALGRARAAAATVTAGQRVAR